MLGDASEDALAVPATWDDVPQGERFQAHRFELKEGEEKRMVEDAFQQSLKIARIPITVVGVERVQNYASTKSTARSFQACACALVVVLLLCTSVAQRGTAWRSPLFCC